MQPIQILRVSGAQAQAQYETFVKANHGTIEQSYEWGQFQEKIPLRGRFVALMAMEGQECVASMLLVRQRLPFGKCWLSVARGPLFHPGADIEPVWSLFLPELKRIAKAMAAIFIRFELPEYAQPGQQQQMEKLLNSDKNFRLAHAHYQPEWTLKINLSGSINDILGQMKQKGRYNIKVAQKHGVTIRVTHDSRDVKAFYEILQKTCTRDGFGIHSEHYYQTLVTFLVKNDLGTLYVAEKDGQIMAGMVATFYGETGTYYYGASDHAHRPLMAPYLLQWEALQEAKRRGCLWYDFLGVAPPDSPYHPWAGVTDFKEKFGGVRVEYPKAREWVLKRGWYWGMRVMKIFVCFLRRIRMRS
jgi:lipid II:glycine glycyltransferase (peptidoglycan interpeptide bridge formation enzyme)